MPRIKVDPSIPLFDFQLNPEKKELSATTVKMYKNYLNKITAASYNLSKNDKRKKPILNKKDLLTKYKQVVEIITSLPSSREIKCGYFSAVFYAIGSKNLEKNKKMDYIVQEFRKIYYDDKYREYQQKVVDEE